VLEMRFFKLEETSKDWLGINHEDIKKDQSYGTEKQKNETLKARFFPLFIFWRFLLFGT